MKHIVYTSSDTYPIALLVKNSAFTPTEIEATYTKRLESEGISRDDMVAVSLAYNDSGKAPVKFIKEFLAELMPNLASVGTQYIYCADAAYFKTLTGARKAEPHLGYVLDCTWEGCEHMKVVLGVNHKSLIYNPANEPKLDLSLNTLTQAINNTYEALGADIIRSAEYPQTLASIKTALDNLHQYDTLAADIEGFSLDFDKAGVGTCSFAWSEFDGIAFPCDYVSLPKPVDGEYGYQKHNPEVKKLLREFLEAYKGKLRWHNTPYDLGVLIYELWMKSLQDTAGMLKGLETVTRLFHDTKIIAYLAQNTTAGNDLSLKSLAHEFAGNWAQDDIKDIRRIPLDKLLQYNLVDSLACNYVYKRDYPKMVADQQDELYYSLMLPSLKTIIQIELTGMPLNPVRVQEAKAELQGIVDGHMAVIKAADTIRQFNVRLRKEEMDKANAKLKIKQHPISAFAHVEFNPNSDIQAQKLLYEVMQLPVISRTKGKAPSVGGETLEKLINHTKNPEYQAILTALIGLASADKILTSFIPAFEAAIDHGDDVVWLHGSFNLGGTVSGRLSSSNPNLQNIPSGSVYGKLIKSCFQAPTGWIFCGADFNSLEDYISALTTRDPNKMKVYQEGYDGHCLRAYSYWPEKFPDITDTPKSVNTIKKLYGSIRQASKAPTFALTYQGTFSTLMKNCGFSRAEAKRIEANYHELYKVSVQWVQDRLDQAAKDGYVELAFGLRLRTPLLAQTIRGNKATPREAEAEGRTAGNALGQSYGLLNNRAVNAFMQKVWVSKYRHDILPVALIHDAIYLVIQDSRDVVAWVNDNLIEEMRWQELPEIQDEVVKLGAELSLFWPNWANEIVLPNDCDKATITHICSDAIKEYRKAA